MKTYSEVRKDTAQRMGESDVRDPGNDPMNCMFCGATTTRKVLSMLGARCGPCFDRYMTSGHCKSRPAKPADPRFGAWLAAATEEQANNWRDNNA